MKIAFCLICASNQILAEDKKSRDGWTGRGTRLNVRGGNCTLAEFIRFAAVFGSVCVFVELLEDADLWICQCLTKYVYIWKRFSEHSCVSIWLCMHFGLEKIMLSASANEVVKRETTYFIRLSGKEISLTVSLSICLSFHVFSFTSCAFYSLCSPDSPTSVWGL